MVEGRARILAPGEESDRAEAAIAANYGRTRTLYEGALYSGVAMVYVEVTPEAGAAGAADHPGAAEASPRG